MDGEGYRHLESHGRRYLLLIEVILLQIEYFSDRFLVDFIDLGCYVLLSMC